MEVMISFGNVTVVEAEVDCEGVGCLDVVST
jgi:hypothetical protein